MSKAKAKTAPPPFKLSGIFIQQTFSREYKKHTGCTDNEAEAVFQLKLISEEIQAVGFSGLMKNVTLYVFKPG